MSRLRYGPPSSREPVDWLQYGLAATSYADVSGWLPVYRDHPTVPDAPLRSNVGNGANRISAVQRERPLAGLKLCGRERRLAEGTRRSGV
jgi:hypothetical protein